jgi:hypothetical protein
MDRIINIGNVGTCHRRNGKAVTIRNLVFSFSIPAESDIDRRINKQTKNLHEDHDIDSTSFQQQPQFNLLHAAAKLQSMQAK